MCDGGLELSEVKRLSSGRSCLTKGSAGMIGLEFGVCDCLIIDGNGFEFISAPGNCDGILGTGGTSDISWSFNNPLMLLALLVTLIGSWKASEVAVDVGNSDIVCRLDNSGGIALVAARISFGGLTVSGTFGFLVRSCLPPAGTAVSAVVVAGPDSLSFFTRCGARSSGAWLLVCRSEGMMSLLNS